MDVAFPKNADPDAMDLCVRLLHKQVNQRIGCGYGVDDKSRKYK
jgi:hypothetical protein